MASCPPGWQLPPPPRCRWPGLLQRATTLPDPYATGSRWELHLPHKFTSKLSSTPLPQKIFYYQWTIVHFVLKIQNDLRQWIWRHAGYIWFKGFDLKRRKQQLACCRTEVQEYQIIGLDQCCPYEKKEKETNVLSNMYALHAPWQQIAI